MQSIPKAARKEILGLTGRKGLVVGIANEHSLARTTLRLTYDHRNQ